jgi:hypothetical protein
MPVDGLACPTHDQAYTHPPAALQVPYSGFAMGARFMDTIAWAHALRTLAFLTTVLPNPRPNCYARNFPPVPSGERLQGWEKVAASAFGQGN